jgi:hypothetical protein
MTSPKIKQRVTRDIKAYMKTAEFRRNQKAIDAYNRCVEKTGGSAECIEILERCRKHRSGTAGVEP